MAANIYAITPVTTGSSAYRAAKADGFTLTEVVFALGIIMTSVSVILVLIANSQRQTQLNRDQIMAATVAAHLAEGFAYGGDTELTAISDQNLPAYRATGTLTAPYTGSRQSDLMRSAGMLQIMGAAGQFDMEQRLLGPQGPLRPLPPDLAQRIDSPGDIIARHLDAGGQIYYISPDIMETGALNADRGELMESLGRLLVMFPTPPQQGALAHHPLIFPQRRMYPFAPNLSAIGDGRKNTQEFYFNSQGAFPYEWDAADSTVLPEMNRYVNEADPVGRWEGLNGVLKPQKQSDTALKFLGHDLKTWNWFAKYAPDGKPAGWQAKWQSGLDQFHHVLIDHWLRLYHQIDATDLPSPSEDRETQVTSTTRVQVGWRNQEVERWVTTVDANRNVSQEKVVDVVQVPVYEERDGETRTVITKADQSQSWRGIPAPPPAGPTLDGSVWSSGADRGLAWNPGLPAAPSQVDWENRWPIDLRNADDMPIVAMSQLRTGLPGLGARKAYLDAAIALWNIVGRGGDPLSGTIDTSLPIHPAEVLSLNYVAHAAMMVTGYKPPFAARNNTPDASSWTADMSAGKPDYYRWRSERDFTFYLVGSEIQVLLDGSQGEVLAEQTVDGYTWQELTTEVDGSMGGGRQTGILPPDITYVDVIPADFDDSATGPIVFGQVHNPFPPPYANDTDTANAGRALRNLHGLLNQYIGANPYCHIVPRPLNRQTSWDQPLYAKDLFPDWGLAQDHFHPIAWGPQDAAFPPFVYAADYASESDRMGWLATMHGIDTSGDGRFSQSRSAGEDRFWLPNYFKVPDRTRRMIIFSAPWQSYEDFERVRAAPVDFSNLTVWRRNRGGTGNFEYETRPQMRNYGHPEDRAAWANPARDATAWGRPAEAFVSDADYDTRSGGPHLDLHGHAFTNIPYVPSNDSRRNIWTMFGYWGADRNGNGQWDRPTLTPTQRIRATEVGNFVFYDPVLWVPIR